MAIIEVGTHPYRVEKEGDRVTVTFLTGRSAYFTLVFLIFLGCVVILRTGYLRGWNGTLLSGLVGASVSIVLVPCFALWERMTRYVVMIEPDLVRLQRRFQGIPVGFGSLYARSSVTDLGIYPIAARERVVSFGQLCLWADGRSVVLECYFPVTEAVALADDFREVGVTFEKTRLSYEQDRDFLSEDTYLSL